MNKYKAFIDNALQAGADMTAWAGLPGSSRSLAIYESARNTTRTTLVVCSSSAEAERIHDELTFFSGGDTRKVIHIPDTEVLPYDLESPHGGITSQRARALHELAKSNEGRIVVTSSLALVQRVASRKHWAESFISIKEAESTKVSSLVNALISFGYTEKAVDVENPGEFSIRNEILDVFPIGSSHPYRIRMSNGQVESIFTLNIFSQRSVSSVSSIEVLSSREMPIANENLSLFRQNYRKEFGYRRGDFIYESVGKRSFPAGIESLFPLFSEKTETILDYISDNAPIFLIGNVVKSISAFWEQLIGRYEDLRLDKERRVIVPERLWLPSKEIKERISKHKVVFLFESRVPGAPVDYQGELTLIKRQPDLRDTISQLASWVHRSNDVIFAIPSIERRNEVELICQMLNLDLFEISSWSDFSVSRDGNKRAFIVNADLCHGFYMDELKLLLITESEIFGQVMFSEMEGDEDQLLKKEQDLEGLEVGEPIIHVEYGVGRFNGLQEMTLNGVTKEFLTIRYAEAAIAYVGMEDLDMISRYSGISVENAPLDALRSEKWKVSLNEAVDNIIHVAKSLNRIREEKKKQIGIRFKKPGYDYQQFAGQFPFQMTHDQLQAVKEIFRDMISNQPMDRIVCGDVGFGKTEVAQRASFLAVKSGYQVAVMVPTTLLANQHFESFQKRFAGFNVNIRCLSGLDRKQEMSVLEEIENGQVDIIIGTQRLIQKDVSFKRLGLFIIDEEHRFGVKDKGAMLKVRQNIDVLSMTATPIPRTMGIAMHGIRDISSIFTPPSKRLSIRTLVKEMSESTVREAIQREMMRDGQVFILHNRVASIHQRAEEIKAIAPDRTVDIIHGQMSEDELELVMSRFHNHQTNILICTTIVENGINVPNANTILIENADKLGLAQLHQLRGRVGRSNRQAYAYLFKSKSPTEDGLQRLRAMEHASKLGSGLLIATHDMEIRGAGEVLGEEQSGEMIKIGSALYFRLLKQAISLVESGEDIGNLLDNRDVNIDTMISGSIKKDYIENDAVRLSLYKRITSVKEMAELKALIEEIKDRFGPMPESCLNLFQIEKIRLYLRKIGIKRIKAGRSSGLIELRKDHRLNPARLVDMVNSNPDTYKLTGPYTMEFSFDMGNQDKFFSSLLYITGKLIENEK